MTTAGLDIEIGVVDTLPDRLSQSAWHIYEAAMQSLTTQAVQRHLLYRNEFDDIMRSPVIDKYLAYDADGLCAIGTFTRDLYAVPLISPPYFAQRWPAEYMDRRIWYVPFLAVAPHAQGNGAFHAIAARMLQDPAREGGLVVLDVCAYNESRGFPQLVEKAVRDYTDVDVCRLDEQSYWGYGFPVLHHISP